jgi:nicotinamide phosphoribosyltransferase
MCLGGQETEFETYKRLITEVYPKGLVSIVSDTWDYWHVLNVTIRTLKDKIMAREGSS